jgi:DNA polymerase-3 subunit gamma/tau
MGRALYRKYRPTSFEQAVGQEHITKTLKCAIKSGKISHAYLFTGPRGIGKTSVARILAHEVNGLSYTDDSIHLDIIEIDAASNRRIDEIRELRDKVHISPTSAKYKVYIIDEVHMLTREAFNALLKTLEEPPAHCIFILATTEVHKLPETIISRTQRFSFSPVSTKIAAEHLEFIAKEEKINITKEALELIAQHGQGSFRDSISLLDQLSNIDNKITGETVRGMLGLPPEPAIIELLEAIEDGNSAKLLQNLDDLLNNGSNPAVIAKELGRTLRSKLIDGENSSWIPELMRDLLEVSSSANPSENLEIALLEAAAVNSNGPSKQSGGGSGAAPTAKNSPPEKETKKQNAPQKESAITQSADTNTEEKQKIIYSDFDISTWPQVVEYAKKHAASLYTALKIAKPAHDNGTLTLYFQFPLHQKKLNQAQQKALIGQIIEEVAHSKVKVDCEVNKDMFNNSKTSPAKEEQTVIAKSVPEPAAPLKSISNIFGHAEVLESN